MAVVRGKGVARPKDTPPRPISTGKLGHTAKPATPAAGERRKEQPRTFAKPTVCPSHDSANILSYQ